LALVNVKSLQWPAEKWLHGRHQGQNLPEKLLEYLEKTIGKASFKSVVLSKDFRFKIGNEEKGIRHTSNWLGMYIALV